MAEPVQDEARDAVLQKIAQMASAATRAAVLRDLAEAYSLVVHGGQPAVRVTQAKS